MKQKKKASAFHLHERCYSLIAIVTFGVRITRSNSNTNEQLLVRRLLDIVAKDVMVSYYKEKKKYIYIYSSFSISWIFSIWSPRILPYHYRRTITLLFILFFFLLLNITTID